MGLLKKLEKPYGPLCTSSKALGSTRCRCTQELPHFQTEFGHTFKAWLCTTLLNSVDQNKQI